MLLGGCKHVVRPLVGLSGKVAESGAFFLGCGSIGCEAVYVYAYRKTDGGIHMITAPAATCLVYEDATAATAFLDYDKWSWGRIDTRLHVPPGTLSAGYDVGMLRPEKSGVRP